MEVKKYLHGTSMPMRTGTVISAYPVTLRLSPHVEMHHEEEEEEDHHDDEDMDEHEEAEESSRGRLENSFGEFTGGSVGGALILDQGHFGVALIRRDSEVRPRSARPWGA